jgi:hypothetical protein
MKIACPICRKVHKKFPEACWQTVVCRHSIVCGTTTRHAAECLVEQFLAYSKGLQKGEEKWKK